MARPLAWIGITMALSACGAPCPAATGTAPDAGATPATFDARAAWDEFEETLRGSYAYLERTDFSVDAQLAHSRELAVRTRDPEAFRSILHRTSFAFTDPHFLVGPLQDSDPNVVPTSADLVISLRGRDLVVADVRAGSPADEAGVRPGWKLVSSDGQPVEQEIARIWSGVVVADTEKQHAYAATLVANGRRAGMRTLGFEVDRVPHTLALENPRAFAKRVDERPPVSLERRGSIGLVRFENSLGKRETIRAFDEAIEKMRDVGAIVLDLRNTPSGGNTDVARSVIGHFLDAPRPYQMHEIPAVERSTSVPRRFVEYVLPRKPRYTGRVAVVGGHWTGSMGEGLVIGMHAAARARAFCSDMGDLLGALHSFDLKRSGVWVEIGAESLFHVDGTRRELFVGDVALTTADRDAAGKDPAMAAVLQWLAKTT